MKKRKVIKCYVNIKDMSHNPSGSRKKWSTDGVKTYLFSTRPAYFVWERDTFYNNYNGYSGYVNCEDVELIE